MKIIVSLIAAACIFFLLYSFCEKRTKGFRVHEILSNQPNHPDWENPPLSAADKEQISAILSQPFYYLGKGDQSYAFLSLDQSTVLKFFKHDHLSVKRLFLKKEDLRLDLSAIFKSCKLAYETLKEESGLIYIHLNKTQNLFNKVTIFDKIGMRHEIDLDATEFILQKKADLFFSTFKQLIRQNNVDEAKKIITSYFNFLEICCSKKVRNSDLSMNGNLGLIDDRVVCIDIGTFINDRSLKNKSIWKNEIAFSSNELCYWLKRQSPELYQFYKETLSNKFPD